MKVLIDDYGAYLKKKGNRFVITSDEKDEEFSSDKVSQILIPHSRGCPGQRNQRKDAEAAFTATYAGGFEQR